MEGVHQAAIEWYHNFEDCPPDLHLCCPRIDDEDHANYDEPDAPDPPETGGTTAEEKKKRIKDYEGRFQNTYDLSILMGLGREIAGPWLDNWTQAVEACLTKCDSCVRNWHRNRDSYLKGL